MAAPETPFLAAGPANGQRVVLAHGAGAPMDSPFMAAWAEGLAAAGYRVLRFEFPYMAARRSGGGRRPPDREAVLLAAWRAAIAAAGPPGQLVIGGKSMGGRMASMVAQESGVRGLFCLGYPFHAPGRPERPRIEHLLTLTVPTLIVQGERDPFGRREEVEGYGLPSSVQVQWAPDGDHDLAPRRTSGRTTGENWAEGIAAAGAWLEALVEG